MGPVPAPKKALLYAIPPVTQKEADNLNKNFFHQSTFVLTSSSCITQLLTDHSSINSAPAIITHCPPLVIDAHLHSTFILIGASHQTNITISTVSTGIYCKQWLQFYCHQDLIFGSNKLVKYTTLCNILFHFHKPWHRTPAYEWTEEQLIVELRGQSVRLVSLPVHWTSSRYTVRVPELAPKWELRKATASVEGEKSLTEKQYCLEWNQSENWLRPP